MGEVYLAEDLLLRRHVALKMLRPDCCDDETEARLLREARAASALNHPGIAVIYEIGEALRPAGKALFIAMEYVAGETLAEAAQRGDVPLDRLLDWVRQAAEALGEAHARGIVHRDVKPSNLVVSPAGRVKVLDFGLAQRNALPGSTESTWSRSRAREGDGALVGTLAYMAPEQALGEAVDGRADVFSLGAVLFELVHGKAAFPGKNAPQVLHALLHKPPDDAAARFDDPRVPGIRALIARMLSKEREARPRGHGRGRRRDRCHRARRGARLGEPRARRVEGGGRDELHEHHGERRGRLARNGDRRDGHGGPPAGRRPHGHRPGTRSRGAEAPLPGRRRGGAGRARRAGAGRAVRPGRRRAARGGKRAPHGPADRRARRSGGGDREDRREDGGDLRAPGPDRPGAGSGAAGRPAASRGGPGRDPRPRGLRGPLEGRDQSEGGELREPGPRRGVLRAGRPPRPELFPGPRGARLGLRLEGGVSRGAGVPSSARSRACAAPSS